MPSWLEMHGALTHFPVALILAAAAFEAGAITLNKPEWRTVSFWMLACALVSAIPTLISGWVTANQLFGGHPGSVLSTHRLAGFLTTGLAALALIWRIAARDRFSGRSLAGPAALLFLAAGTVGYTGYLGGRMVLGGTTGTESVVEASPLPPSAAPTPDPAVAVIRSQGCLNCHRIDGFGGLSGPDLTHEARRHNQVDWQLAHLRNPQAVTPGSMMPSFGQLPPLQLKALAAYLASRR